MQIDKGKDYFGDLVLQSKSIAIVSAVGTNDSVGAAVALACYLDDQYKKKAIVVNSGDMSQIRPEFFEIHEVLTDFEEKTLRVILDYKGTNIETVDYYKEGDSRLVLEVKPVQRNFDTNRIEYKFSGSHYDLIIAIGAARLADFQKKLSLSDKDLSKAKIINIDNSKENESFGKINIVVPEADSLCGLLLTKFVEWSYTPDGDVGKSLLLGIGI